MSSTGVIILSVVFAAIIFVGVFGNVLVCLVVLLNRVMRSPMNYLLVNLAIADMMLLVFFSPTFVFKPAYTHPDGETGHYLCLFITGETLAWMGGYASAVFLLAIAIERYYAVASPHNYGTSFITKHLKLLVLACWMFAFAWNVSGFFTKYYEKSFGGCGMQWPTTHSFKVYALMSFLTVGIAPSLTMLALYSRVVKTLWFKKTNIQTSTSEESNRLRRKKATKMVLSVTILYLFCWIPELTIFILAAFQPHLLDGSLAYPASVAMVSINSALNPILYSLYNNYFRRHLKRMICSCCGCLKTSQVTDVITVSQGVAMS